MTNQGEPTDPDSLRQSEMDYYEGRAELWLARYEKAAELGVPMWGDDDESDDEEDEPDDD